MQIGTMCAETDETLNMDVAVNTDNCQHVTEIAAKINNLVEELKPLAATLNNQNFASSIADIILKKLKQKENTDNNLSKIQSYDANWKEIDHELMCIWIV